MLAHESVHDEVVDRIDEVADSWVVSDLFDEETDISPLIDEAHAKQVETLVEEAIEAGAELVRGGSRDGASFEPTLLTNVLHDARIIHEEQFGPVVAVTTFSKRTKLSSWPTPASSRWMRPSLPPTTTARCGSTVLSTPVRFDSTARHPTNWVICRSAAKKSSSINREGIHSTIKQMLRTKSIIL